MSKKTAVVEKPIPSPLPLSTVGMAIDQLITMLQAGQAQGATHVRLGVRSDTSEGFVSDVDWVSMEPLIEKDAKGNDEGVLYIGALLDLDKWEPMSNAAMESLDW